MEKQKSDFEKNMKSKNNVFSFLYIIKKKVSQINFNNYNENTLLCYTLLLFCLKKKCCLSKNELEEYVKSKLWEKDDKITSVFENYHEINQYNYSKKFNELLNSNDCFIKYFDKKTNKEQVKLNFDYINKEKDSIYNLIFGENLIDVYKEKEMIKKYNNLLQDNDERNNISHNTNGKKENGNNKINGKSNNKEALLKFNNNNNNNKKKHKKNTNNVINIAENKIFYSELNIISPKKKTSDFVENHFEEDDKNKESLINSLISSILDVESLNESNKKPFKEKEYNFSPKILSFIQKGEEFISLINSFNFDKITGMNNYLIMISNYKNNKSLEKCLMTAKKDYYNLIEFLKCFKDTNLLCDKNNVSLKKQECSLLICKIIKELSQFLIDYNFVIELVNSNKYNTYSRMLKKIKKLDKDNVLNQDNVNVIKLIMEKELENEAI